MQKRAAINARVSGRVQEQEGYSLDDQVERCGLYCAARGYQVVHINREVASGGELDGRDGMWQILKMIERGEVDVVVQTVLDRLSRDHTHTEVLIYTAEKHGVSLEFVDETFDDSPEGRVMRAMKSVFADMERQRITERLLRGRRSRARAGKLLATSIPLYGYRWSGDDKGAYVIHEETGQIVVRIYEWAAAGRVLMWICRTLTSEGVLTPRDQYRKDKGDPKDPPRGAPWRRQTVDLILHHPAYHGEHVAFLRTISEIRREVDPATGRARTIKSRRIRVQGEEGRVEIPGSAPALVSRELAEAARERLTANKKESTRNNKHMRDALLRGGYLKCSQCGKTMHIHGRNEGSKSFYYYCPSVDMYDDPGKGKRQCPVPRINAATTDERVWAAIYSVIQHPDRLKAEILRRIDSGESQKNALESFDKLIADADRFLANIARNTAHIDDPEEAAPFVAQAKEYTEQKKNAIEARGAMRASIADRERVEAQLRDFALWCEVFKGHPEIWTYERKRVALYALEIEVRANPYGSDEPFSIEAGPKNDAGERAIIPLLPDVDSVQTQKYVLRGGTAAIARQ